MLSKKWCLSLTGITLITLSCAHRLPPPGKPEIAGPEIRVLNLNELAEVSDTLKFTVEAIDSSGVKFVRVGIDGIFIEADSSEPFEFILDVSNLSDTVHTLDISATDTWDNSSSLRLKIIKKPLSKPDTLEIKPLQGE